VADLSDVTAYLASAVAAAVYPSGTTGGPSVCGLDCRIYEGWPIPDQLDLDMAGNVAGGAARTGGPVANISVFPMLGTGVTTYQIQDAVYTIAPAALGLTVSVAGNVVTVSGAAQPGEYITLICDGNVVFSRTNPVTSLILGLLAVDAQAVYPSAFATATTLTVPVARSLVVRQGGIGTLGKVTHRQRHSVMITVWSPNRVARNALASAIDVALKANVKVTMPDTSQALIVYSRTNVSDELQSSTIYRRDLIYDVEYATLQTFPGYVITSVNTTIASASGNAQASAIT
jgi:hypothetical protein